MTATAPETSETSALMKLNRELAALLRRTPASLPFGADLAIRDPLVVCGLLGGKDVGKSTLINALAGERVSVDEAEVGRGTDHAVAYVHESAQDTVTSRLRALDKHLAVEVVTHRADAIRWAALIDLPDFDSEYLDHLRIVRGAAPLLDRVIWVLTPRKVGDRAWVQLARDVVKDGVNVRFVLNKLDELLTDADALNGPAHASHRPDDRAGRFWMRQQRWLTDSTAIVGPVADIEDTFLVAARFPTSGQFVERIAYLWNDTDLRENDGERSTVTAIGKRVEDEILRLRTFVLTSADESTRHRIKEANRRREQQVGAERLRAEYDVDRVAVQLNHALDPAYAAELIDEAFPPAFRAAAGAIIRAHLGQDRQLADEWLERRVEQWPLLRIVHWPFGWAARIAGRGLGAFGSAGMVSASVRTQDRDVTDPLDVMAPSARERVEMIRTRLSADHAAVAGRLKWEQDMPGAEHLAAAIGAKARDLPQHLQEAMLTALQAQERRPSRFARAFTWLIFLWFPFVQPLLAGGLEIIGEDGAIHTARGVLRMVTALSATHLLAGFAVVGVVFLAMLVGMYARRLRAVRRWRAANESPLIAEAIDELLHTQVMAPLIEPIRIHHERLTSLINQLDKQTSDAG